MNCGPERHGEFVRKPWRSHAIYLQAASYLLVLRVCCRTTFSGLRQIPVSLIMLVSLCEASAAKMREN